jgi:hypothetical protein
MKRCQTRAYTFTLVVAASLACSLYASFDARGVYADAAGLVVVIYEMKRFFVSGTRIAVEIMRQAPIVLLARYTSATLFECAQAFTFVMLTLPTMLCALCWWIAPHNRKAWIRLCGNLSARDRRSGDSDELLLDFAVRPAVQHSFN